MQQPLTKDQRARNKELLELAHQIRNREETNLKTTYFGFPDPGRRRMNFIDYYREHLKNYTNKDIRLVKCSFDHFVKYVNKEVIIPPEIDENFIKGFKNYLEEKLNGDTPYNYFTKFKQLCKQATRDGLFPEDPAVNVSVSRSNGLKKEILTFDEIKRLSTTQCGNDEIKAAFLFCLNTGLRFVDVKSLLWQHIDLPSNLLRKEQTKVRHSSKAAYVYIDLNSNARAILENRKKGLRGDFIFKLPSIESSLRTLKRWTQKAGIVKNITWHSSRHSFATNLLYSNTDIVTVSRLLGHSDLKHTQKYTHLVDELKKRAVNSLPDLY
jgi:integrase